MIVIQQGRNQITKPFHFHSQFKREEVNLKEVIQIQRKDQVFFFLRDH